MTIMPIIDVILTPKETINWRPATTILRYLLLL
jgi:hypothetical protein